MHSCPIPSPSEPVLRRRRVLAALGSLPALLAGCAATDSGDEVWRPWVGRGGKDVMWVPTLDAVVMPMLELAAVRADDIVYDLGSGDGKIPIWAARRFGARAVGIEYDAKLSELAQRNAVRAGVTDRVRMIRGDIFVEDFSTATVLTLYLGQALNLRLRPIILGMRPGTRVVSNNFDMEHWEPDRTVRIEGQNPLFLWIVPARIAGTWMLDGLPEAPSATLRLTQNFQKVEGTLEADGRRLGRVDGRLDGEHLALAMRSAEGSIRQVQAKVAGDALTGTLDTSAPRTLRARRAP
jgi:SAM-dependent methyltransferase